MILTQILAFIATVAETKAVDSGPDLSSGADKDVSTYPIIPSYTMHLPVDHFDKTNTDTFANRFFVNDTYYKQGGPVIFFEVGEVGISPMVAASLFAECNYPSAPCRLAEALNGLVIGWEHRYYGLSRPVALDDNTGLPSSLDGYKYLTVGQAIEDAAYFANRFNTTVLSQNSVLGSTAGLGPYNTPWINVGGSYPGMKTAWSRITHPEIFYATWSSSAALQVQADGSPYFNPVLRSMPPNCTADFKAAVKFADQLMTGGNETETKLLQQALNVASNGLATPVTASETDKMSIGSALNLMIALWGTYQTLGPTRTTQRMCDYAESFDGNAFLQGDLHSWSFAKQNETIFRNPGGVPPSTKGIATKYGGIGGPVALAAFLYGSYHASQDLHGLPRPFEPFTDNVDHHSWYWQTMNEIGLHIGSSRRNPTQVLSKYYSYSTDRQVKKQLFFGAFNQSKLPEEPNTGPLLALGGWNMKASNTMFTNGELDNWRAFSVASQETGYGAPQRKVTQRVPACNTAPANNDVFGITYRGAVHVEDVLAALQGPGGSQEKVTPLEQGLALFLDAWHVWRPCFEKSRDDVRSSKIG